MGRIVVTGKSDPLPTGEMPGSVQLNVEGNVMPAFTFEKLSPPTARGAPPVPAPVVAAPKKPRRLLGHMIDRFVEARVRKNLRKKSGGAPQPPK
jgi:hypothetical protein